MKITGFKTFSVIDAAVLFLCSLLLSASLNQSGDTSTALYFLLTLLFIFVSVPLLLATATVAFTNNPIYRIRICYVLLSLVAHLWLAYGMGFFDKAIDNYERQLSLKANPALQQLRMAMNRTTDRDIALIVEALSQGADPDSTLVDGVDLPLLLIATNSNDVDAVQALLGAGANPNVKATVEVKDISTPAPIDIVLLGDGNDSAAFETLELLLNAGANVENSLLALGACFRGSLEIYMRAKEMASNTDQDLNGNSCMHYAVMNNQIEFLQNVFSAANDYPEIVRHLNLSNARNIKPLTIAERENLTEMESYLLSMGALSQ